MGIHPLRTLRARVTLGIALLASLASLLVAGTAGAATSASRSTASSTALTASYAGISKQLQPHVAMCYLPSGKYGPYQPCPYSYITVNVTSTQSSVKLLHYVQQRTGQAISRAMISYMRSHLNTVSNASLIAYLNAHRGTRITAKLVAELRNRSLLGSVFKVIKGAVKAVAGVVLEALGIGSYVACSVAAAVKTAGYVASGDWIEIPEALDGDYTCSHDSVKVVVLGYRLFKSGAAEIVYQH